MTLNTMSTLGARKTSPEHIGAWVLPSIAEEAWRENAACQKFPPQLWDPATTATFADDKRRWEQAVAVCVKCPVIAQCGEAAGWRDAGMIRAAKLVNGKGELVDPPAASHLLPTQKISNRNLEPAPCGSPSAKTRHGRHREDCKVCWPNGKRGSRMTLAPCPSRDAKRRHQRRGEACVDCDVDYRTAA